MKQNIQKLWSGLDRKILVNQRELVLGIAACTLAGIVTGIVLSPKKTVAIGSNNGSNNTGNSAGLPAEIPVTQPEAEGE